MTSVTSGASLSGDPAGVDPKGPRPDLDHGFDVRGLLIFFGIIACGLGYAAWNIWSDMRAVGAPVVTYLPFVLLAMKFIVRNPAIYREPEGRSPPLGWIRAFRSGCLPVCITRITPRHRYPIRCTCRKNIYKLWPLVGH